MIQVFDTVAAGHALARRKLPCPDCDQALKPWGHARERTVRDLDGELVTLRPDRALCDGCKVTHVVLDAGLLPRRAYSAGLIGQALVAAARGSGHRSIARDLDIAADTVRGWIRGARRSAIELRVTAVRFIVSSGRDVPDRWPPSELGLALENLGVAAWAMGCRRGLQHTSPWARVSMLTRGKLLNMSPAG